MAYRNRGQKPGESELTKMKFSGPFYEKYGMPMLSLDELDKLHPYERETRNNKYDIIVACSNMRKLIDTIEHRAKGTPVENNRDHAIMVTQFRQMVEKALHEVDIASTFGII